MSSENVKKLVEATGGGDNQTFPDDVQLEVG
jgi:hypothetical protein